MPYFYSDPDRESDPQALPDVEAFHAAPGFKWHDRRTGKNVDVSETIQTGDRFEELPAGYWYAFGSPDCLWDSEPVGPFKTEEEALGVAQIRKYIFS